MIRQWASLLLLSRLGERKSAELLLLALVRGRMCQLLGARQKKLSPNELFTAGVLSVLDAPLDREMEIVVSGLPLAQPTWTTIV